MSRPGKTWVASGLLLCSLGAEAACGSAGIGAGQFDFDADGCADLLWQQPESGKNLLWLSSESFAQDRALAPTQAGWQLLTAGDFNADKTTDLLWQQTESGFLLVQRLSKGQVAADEFSMAPAAGWQWAAAADINADNRTDLLWRHQQTGDVALYLKTATGFEIRMLPKVEDLQWKIAGFADFNGDGKADLLWRHAQTGRNYLWLLNSEQILEQAELPMVGLDWQLQAASDQTADGKADLLWRHRQSGQLYLWAMQGATLKQEIASFSVADPNWQLMQLADYDGDGQVDQLWRHAITGDNRILQLRDAQLLGEQPLAVVNPESGWQLALGAKLTRVESVYRHGDWLQIAGDWGSNAVHKTFLGGADGLIEAQPEGGQIANAQGWRFSDLGHPTQVVQDAKRGKVLFTPQDSQHYNADRRYDPGFAIPEQRYFYKAHYVRNRLELNGQPFSKSYQWKHERVNWENSIVDGLAEIKIHSWFGANTDVLTFINRSQNDSSVLYGGQAAQTNADWALMEMMVYTGTEGKADGKLVTRVFKNGQTYISENHQAVAIYTNPSLRLRYFLEQNYFGNFSQIEAGVDNALPRPDRRELYSDDSQILIGLDADSGWKRVELRDSLDLKQAKIREVQDWQQWDDGAIRLKLNTGGLPSGIQDLYLVVIDGVDAEGWDRVLASQKIRVQVP